MRYLLPILLLSFLILIIAGCEQKEPVFDGCTDLTAEECEQVSVMTESSTLCYSDSDCTLKDDCVG